MQEYKIYKLTEPDDIELKHVYIGFTTRSLNRRLNEHISHAQTKNYYLSNWIKQLNKIGKRPKISLVKITDQHSWEAEEISEIKKFRLEENTTGIKVLNLTDGGECGMLGRKHSEETKKKISEAKKGKCTCTEDSHKKMLDTFSQYGNPNVGRKASDEERRKLSISHIGNKSALGHTLTLDAKLQIAEKKSKFSVDDLHKIKTMLDEGVKEKEIISTLGVTRWAVYSVKHNKRLILKETT